MKSTGAHDTHSQDAAPAFAGLGAHGLTHQSDGSNGAQLKTDGDLGTHHSGAGRFGQLDAQPLHGDVPRSADKLTAAHAHQAVDIGRYTVTLALGERGADRHILWNTIRRRRGEAPETPGAAPGSAFSRA